MDSNEGAANWSLSWQFYPLLNGIDGGEMVRYYWVICDHRMLNYGGIFPCLS
jgi:hypothetical protein